MGAVGVWCILVGSDERHSSDSKIVAFRIHLQHETLPKRSLAMSKSSARIHSKIEFFTWLYLCICSIFEAFKVASAEHVTSCHKHHPILQTIFRNASFLIFPSRDLSYPSDMDHLFLIYLPSLGRPLSRVSKALYNHACSSHLPPYPLRNQYTIKSTHLLPDKELPCRNLPTKRHRFPLTKRPFQLLQPTAMLSLEIEGFWCMQHPVWTLKKI